MSAKSNNSAPYSCLLSKKIATQCFTRSSKHKNQQRQMSCGSVLNKPQWNKKIVSGALQHQNEQQQQNHTQIWNLKRKHKNMKWQSVFVFFFEIFFLDIASPCLLFSSYAFYKCKTTTDIKQTQFFIAISKQ